MVKGAHTCIGTKKNVNKAGVSHAISHPWVWCGAVRAVWYVCTRTREKKAKFSQDSSNDTGWRGLGLHKKQNATQHNTKGGNGGLMIRTGGVRQNQVGRVYKAT